MVDFISNLKIRARLLQRNIREGDADALSRVRKSKDFKALDDDDIMVQVQRRHCLNFIAAELGFPHWHGLKQILSGAVVEDYGTALYRRGCGAHFNIWSASYDEAAGIRAEHGGTLLPYKNQFIVVDDDYLREIGLDPGDPDLAAIERDWAKPKDHAARSRLYEKVLVA
jgi:hypothetical protein